MQEKIKNALNNDCGGPNVEEVIGIAYGLSVGAGLFIVGKAMYNWLKGASTAISSISYAVPT